MNVKIYFKDAANPKEFTNVIDTFQEGSMFCIFYHKNEEKFIRQFPLMHIFYVERSKF